MNGRRFCKWKRLQIFRLNEQPVSCLRLLVASFTMMAFLLDLLCALTLLDHCDPEKSTSLNTPVSNQNTENLSAVS